MKERESWFRRFAALATFSGLLVFWMGMAWHYWSVLVEYAANNYHVKYTALYIAIECWLLVCLIIVTLLMFRLLVIAERR